MFLCHFGHCNSHTHACKRTQASSPVSRECWLYGIDNTRVVFGGRALLFHTSSRLDGTAAVSVGSSAPIKKLITLLVPVHSASPSWFLYLWEEPLSSVPCTDPDHRCARTHTHTKLSLSTCSSISLFFLCFPSLLSSLLPPLLTFLPSLSFPAPCFNFPMWCQEP